MRKLLSTTVIVGSLAASGAALASGPCEQAYDGMVKSQKAIVQLTLDRKGLKKTRGASKSVLEASKITGIILSNANAGGVGLSKSEITKAREVIKGKLKKERKKFSAFRKLTVANDCN